VEAASEYSTIHGILGAYGCDNRRDLGFGITSKVQTEISMDGSRFPVENLILLFGDAVRNPFQPMTVMSLGTLNSQLGIYVKIVAHWLVVTVQRTMGDTTISTWSLTIALTGFTVALSGFSWFS